MTAPDYPNREPGTDYGLEVVDGTISGPVITTCVRYFYPGSFFAEESSREVPDRDSRRAALDAPEGAFAFTFFGKVTATAVIDGREVTLRGPDIRRSARFYIGAVAMDAEAVAALAGDHKILLSNMRGNGWEKVAMCRGGWFQPLEPGDVLLDADGEPVPQDDARPADLSEGKG